MLENKKDGNFSYGEKPYFDKVIKYCKNSTMARLFCPEWKKV